MYRTNFGVGTHYHVYSRSIAGYEVFQSAQDYERMSNVLYYYQVKRNQKFSQFLLDQRSGKSGSASGQNNGVRLVDIVAYCLMPTHMHLILRSVQEYGISKFMNDILNSYTRYFNIRHKRKGPLWESRFKSVLIQSQGQILHLSRYIHLNPVTAFLVDKPELWKYSSYREYLNETQVERRLCNFKEVLDMEPGVYKSFVEDNIAYQRESAQIKGLVLET